MLRFVEVLTEVLVALILLAALLLLLVCCCVAALPLISAFASAPQQAALASMAIGIVAAPSAALGAIRFLRQ